MIEYFSDLTQLPYFQNHPTSIKTIDDYFAQSGSDKSMYNITSYKNKAGNLVYSFTDAGLKSVYTELIPYNSHYYQLSFFKRETGDQLNTDEKLIQQTFKFTAQQNTADADLTVADNVVVNFMSDMKGSDYNAAYNKLSAGGQNFVNQEPQTYSQNDRLMYGLYGFISAPALPDNGVSLTNTTKINSSTIKVATVWKYTKTTSTVAFTLKLENGQWKIDKVQ